LQAVKYKPCTSGPKLTRIMPETKIAPYESASTAERSEGKRVAKPEANKTAMLRRVSAAIC
jgi:hypothetical protein